MLEQTAAKGLGWASLGIGLSEIAAPHQLEKMMGIGNHQKTGVLRVLGVREILSGLDILMHDDPTPGLWARVIGDALDLALMGIARRRSRRPSGMTKAFAMVLGITALDVLFAQRLSSRE
jgi:hypothetical protein